ARCWACCRHDSRFPAGLRDAADAPWALIGRGDPALLERLVPEGVVTVVGARRASAYGREVARELGRELTAAGLLVVSGLAFGIDACAHRGALDAGTTVAVLGCGADTAYPANHRSLWRQICERGLVLSELPPGTGAWRWTFPARNRIMAAIAGMTVVVEAAKRSGSLITADLAADLGRDLGAVPGPVNSRGSAGTNELLAGGACLVRDAQDVLDAMLGPGARVAERSGPELAPDLRRVLAVVDGGEETCDGIAAQLRLSGGETAAALATLEMLGYVSCSLVGVYSRTLLAAPDDV
ncbi:MAG: DNA-processing protein DprA, partial [Solirubrobacterales bacterium]